MKARQYQMTARADAAAQTAERIIDAMLTAYTTLPYDRIRLDDVALAADVTAQTVIRRFGGKPGLTIAMVERELGRIVAARGALQGRPPAETVAALAEHYERYGAQILKVYAEAGQVPGLPELAAQGRRYHLQWCTKAFADHLDGGLDAAAHSRRLAQLVAVCDATTWRLLRVDGRLDRQQTAKSMAELLFAVIDE